MARSIGSQSEVLSSRMLLVENFTCHDVVKKCAWKVCLSTASEKGVVAGLFAARLAALWAALWAALRAALWTALWVALWAALWAALGAGL